MRNQLIELGFDVPRRSYGFGDLQESSKDLQDAKVTNQTRGLCSHDSPRHHVLDFNKHSSELIAVQRPARPLVPHPH